MSRIAVATDTPRQNGLLAALPREDYDRLLPHLRRIALPVGSVLHRHHSVEQQLCRWILSCLDRLASNELMVTQGLIARLLGVRRQGVGEGVAHLERAGIIRCRRGRIAVLDRPRLESRVCECYAVVRREFDRLLPGFGQPIVGFAPRGRTGCDFD